MSTDPINHPAHYTAYPVEVIELTEHLNFCRGNVVKYVCRATHKGTELEDLRKAQWYLAREIARLEQGPATNGREICGHSVRHCGQGLICSLDPHSDDIAHECGNTSWRGFSDGYDLGGPA